MGQNGEGSADKIQSIEIIMQRECLNITHDQSLSTLCEQGEHSVNKAWASRDQSLGIERPGFGHIVPIVRATSAQNKLHELGNITTRIEQYQTDFSVTACPALHSVGVQPSLALKIRYR